MADAVHLTFEGSAEGLRDPVVVCAFTGWNDAGEAASSALSFLGTSLEAQRLATIEAEDFYDFQSVRPTVNLGEGGGHALSWPDLEIQSATVQRAERDLVLLSGAEPSLRWRTFCETVLGLTSRVGARTVVGLGSLLADVPHTWPVTVTGLASDRRLVEGLGFRTPTYEGPTGIVGAIHAAAADRGLTAVSLWAPVPHYVAATPNPRGALALVRSLERVVGIALEAGKLEDEAVEYERQVNEAVESDPKVRSFVEQLERAAEAAHPDAAPGTVPSADVLASEFQRFLRQRGDEPT